MERKHYLERVARKKAWESETAYRRACRDLLDLCHEVPIDMSDTFAYACVDVVMFDLSYLRPLIPLTVHYYKPRDVFVAYASLVKKCDPIKPSEQFEEIKAAVRAALPNVDFEKLHKQDSA